MTSIYFFQTKMDTLMKKLLSLTAIIFLATIFSCNKSDVSTSNSVKLSGPAEKYRGAGKNLNVVLFDELHAAAKDSTDPQHEHLHLFDMTYLTDSSQALIESNLEVALTELQSNEVIPPGSPSFTWEETVPWGYCANDGTVMTGFFLDYYVTDKLFSHKKTLKAFKTWFEKVVTDWMNAKNEGPKPKYNKPGEYWTKIIGAV